MPVEPMTNTRLAIPSEVSDASRDAFMQSVKSALSASPREVVVDCASVAVVTSLHISLLWEAKESCDRLGIPFQLYNANAAVRRVLRAMDLDTMFQVIVTIDANAGYAVSEVTTMPMGHFTDTFDATMAAVQEALARFILFVSEHSIHADDAYQLQTAFYEVAANIVGHGQLASADTITVSATVGAGVFELEFRDHGIAFDPTSNTYCDDFRAAARRGATRGLGIGMLYRLVDDIRYRREDDLSNVLTLIKKWGAQ